MEPPVFTYTSLTAILLKMDTGRWSGRSILISAEDGTRANDTDEVNSWHGCSVRVALEFRIAADKRNPCERH
jgi:hypothetical protein